MTMSSLSDDSASPRQQTWEVFLNAVEAYCPDPDRLGAVPRTEDAGDHGVRAMQRARRFAWMHARHAMGMSVFESIRLSQVLAEGFATWSRSGRGRDYAALGERLREIEEQARRPRPLTEHTAFIDAYSLEMGKEDARSAMDAALRAYDSLARRRA